MKTNVSLLALCLAAIATTAFLRMTAGGRPVAFSEHGLMNVGQTLGPLVVISAFIERAVEVVISPWRDPGAAALTGDALAAYRLQTQGYAFVVSLAFSLAASVVGVRAISALVEASSATAMSGRQHMAFTGFDILLTALLLAGGSDGVHQVVTTITTYLDSSKGKMNP